MNVYCLSLCLYFWNLPRIDTRVRVLSLSVKYYQEKLRFSKTEHLIFNFSSLYCLPRLMQNCNILCIDIFSSFPLRFYKPAVSLRHKIMYDSAECFLKGWHCKNKLNILRVQNKKENKNIKMKSRHIEHGLFILDLPG